MALPYEGGNLAQVHTSVVTVTPKMAIDWLAEYALADQRPVNWRKVEALAKALRENRFWPGTLVLAAVGTKTYLLDGQHRLNSIVMSDLGSWFNVLRFEAKTLAEARTVYARIDPLIAGRRFGHAMQGAGGLTASELTATQATSVAAASNLLADGLRSVGSDKREVWLPDERVAAVTAWGPYAQQYYTAIEGTVRHLRAGLKRANTTAIALLTFRYEPERAAAFWQLVATNDGLVKGTPEHSLVNFVLPSRSEQSAQRQTHRLAVCWNAAYEGRSLSLPRVADASKPVALRGTPMNGRGWYHVVPGTVDLVPTE